MLLNVFRFPKLKIFVLFLFYLFCFYFYVSNCVFYVVYYFKFSFVNFFFIFCHKISFFRLNFLFYSDGLMIYGGSNVVLDHISVSWATDENIGSYFSAKNITWSNSLTSEALYDSNHEDDPSGNPGVTEPHSMGTLWAYVGQLSIHHTMFARNIGRNPQVFFYC